MRSYNERTVSLYFELDGFGAWLSVGCCELEASAEADIDDRKSLRDSSFPQSQYVYTVTITQQAVS